MGAGSSTEQRSPEAPEAASGGEPAEPQESSVGPAAEATPGEPAPDPADPATKLLQKNGQLSPVNSLAEQEERSLQEGALNGQEEVVTVTDVGQREVEDVREGGSEREMAMKPTVADELGQDGPEELPEIIDPLPSSESNLEELAQPPESQSSDVGFKKVFKFVGLKFTVKKEKNEKSDAVQLLTVKKDEGEGAGDHQEAGREAEEASPKESELKQSTESPEEAQEEHGQSTPQPAPPSESAPTAEAALEKQDLEPSQSTEPASSPQPADTASPFKKFFTQGWAGWRKKTSFRKTKEEQLEASEQRKEKEKEKGDAEEKEKTREDLAAEPAGPQRATSEARLSAEYEKVELPLEDEAQGSPEERVAPLATEVFDEKVETVAQVHTSTAEKPAGPQTGLADMQTEASVPATPAEAQEEPPEANEEPATPPEPTATGGPLPKPTELSPDGGSPAAEALPESVVSEVGALVSQEGSKAQGSPLKKLFTSSGLKKLSGKKQKGKRGGGEEEAGEQAPESPEEPKGESSASSPEDPEGPSGDLVAAAAAAEAEEGATSDGEKRREGVTPWASFKKMVTPKKRVRRPSESDREEEVEKGKSATLSSTESAASEPQDEEPRRKVDSSVSWEALICVGSSKKRARKASSSDDEGVPKVMAAEEAPRDDQESGDTPAPTAAPGPERAAATGSIGQGSVSPEQASSPTEGDGVSTWESFKRLVTTRKKSRTKLEEKNEDAAGLDRVTSETEAAKEESWVSIRKLIPGRKKKRSDGKPEAATCPADAPDDDPDVPAVVPLSEYDAVEREKLAAQQEAQPSKAAPEAPVAMHVPEELSRTLTHTVVVDVVDGARALVSDAEERSPSWISAAVSSPRDPMDVDLQVQTRELLASETLMEDASLLGGQDTSETAVTSEAEGVSEAVTAPESAGAFGPEEATEVSGAEETTEMVSAISQLSESHDTTEEATPVQEPEGGLDQEELQRRTQEVLQAVVAVVGQAGQEAASAAQELEGPEAEMPRPDQDSGAQQPMPGPDAELAPLMQQVPASHAGGLDGAGAEKPLEQGSAPDSADTLTDSETSSSTPVADVDSLGALDKAVGSAFPAVETQAILTPKEMPPAPSSGQLQAGVPEPSEASQAVTGTEKEGSVETAPHLSDPVGVSASGPHVEPAAGGLAALIETGSVKQEDEPPRREQAGPGPTEGEAAVEGGREEAKAEAAAAQAEQPSPRTSVPRAQTLSDQKAESPVQSSEAALVLAAAAVEEQVLKGAIRILESEDEGASTGVRAASIPAVEKVFSEPDGDQDPAQAQKVEEGPATDASPEAALQAEGQRLAESVLQVAVERLDTVPQAQPTHADGRAAVGKEVAPPASVHKETPNAESPGELAHPDVARDGSVASGQGLIAEVASSGVGEQPPPEELPAQGEEEATSPGLEGSAGPREGQEKPLGEADGPELQSPALGGAETPGSSIGVSPDTNELKLQEKKEGQEEGFQEGQVRRESGDGCQMQTQEITQKQEQDPTRPEPADS